MLPPLRPPSATRPAYRCLVDRYNIYHVPFVHDRNTVGKCEYLLQVFTDKHDGSLAVPELKKLLMDKAERPQCPVPGSAGRRAVRGDPRPIRALAGFLEVAAGKCTRSYFRTIGFDIIAVDLFLNEFVNSLMLEKTVATEAIFPNSGHDHIVGQR